VTPAITDGDQYFCWNYDSFGNRLNQLGSNDISFSHPHTPRSHDGSSLSVEYGPKLAALLRSIHHYRPL
jgi:hypothetical protein